MEPQALVASGCRYRGPARGAGDRAQPNIHLPDRDQPNIGLPDRDQPQRPSADRLSVGEPSHLQPGRRLRSKFYAYAGPRTLRACVHDCPIVTTGDLV